MLIDEIIGKQITNIYIRIMNDNSGIDYGESFIELDNKIIINIPIDSNSDVLIKKLNRGAKSIFSNLSDCPTYYVNRNKKTIGEVANKYKKKKYNIFNILKKICFGIEVIIKEYQPYKIEYKENKLKYVKDRKITDFIWYSEEPKGFFLLDNGYLITEKSVAPHGIGVGLYYYESLDEVIKIYGTDYSIFSNRKKNTI
jgi:hypothetical protein